MPTVPPGAIRQQYRQALRDNARENVVLRATVPVNLTAPPPAEPKQGAASNGKVNGHSNGTNGQEASEAATGFTLGQAIDLTGGKETALHRPHGVTETPTAERPSTDFAN